MDSIRSLKVTSIATLLLLTACPSTAPTFDGSAGSGGDAGTGTGTGGAHTHGSPGTCEPDALGCWGSQPTKCSAAGQWVDNGSSCQWGCDTGACLVGKRVFTTSILVPANMGGLTGADAICQRLAEAANLSGTYKAWLSDSSSTPATRFTQSLGPYILVDNTVFAHGWKDIVNVMTRHEINLTESGGTPPKSAGPSVCLNFDTGVWSATDIDGQRLDSDIYCQDWSQTSGGTTFGSYTSAAGWSTACDGGNTGCDGAHPLYCFEQ